MLELVDFLTSYLPHYRGKERQLLKALEGHKDHGTLDYKLFGERVVYVLRYNIDHTTAFVIDLVIDKRFRGSKTLKYIIGKNWIKHPYLEYFAFERDMREADKGHRRYYLKNFFKQGKTHELREDRSNNADSAACGYSRAVCC